MVRGERWTTPAEIKKKLVPAGQGGGPVLYCENQHCWVHDGESNGIFLGVTGAGKSVYGTQNTVRSLIEAEESFLVVDPKGELYRQNACRLSEEYDVHTIDFRNMLKSERVNVLAAVAELYRSGDPFQKKQASEMLDDLAYTLYPESEHESPFWIDSARSQFIGVVYALLECADADEINMASVHRFIVQGDRKRPDREEPKREWDTYLEHLLRLLPEDSVASSELYSYATTADDTQGGIRSMTMEGLANFQRSEVLRGFVGGDDLHITQMDGEKPLAIWLILPDENPMYSPLAAIIIDQLMRHFVSLAQEKYNGRLPRRMNFLLEEAGNIGKIESLSRMMSAGRSRNIRTFLVLQSLRQLENLYGKTEAETIRSNADLIVMYRTNDFFTLNEMSLLCGNRVADDDIECASDPLITPAQLASLQTGQALVILGGNTKYVTHLPLCTRAFDPSGWREPEPRKDLPPHEKPRTFDLVQYVEDRLTDEDDDDDDDAILAMPFGLSPFGLPKPPIRMPASSSTRFLGTAEKKERKPYETDIVKPYQVAILDWNGKQTAGMKAIADYYKAPIMDVMRAVLPLPHMLPFDDLDEGRKVAALLKAEDLEIAELGFRSEDDEEGAADETEGTE